MKTLDERIFAIELVALIRRFEHLDRSMIAAQLCAAASIFDKRWLNRKAAQLLDKEYWDIKEAAERVFDK
jgi:hypothetical protein